MNKYMIELEEQQLNTILRGLGTLPFIEVYRLIPEIQGQVKDQEKAPELKPVVNS